MTTVIDDLRAGPGSQSELEEAVFRQEHCFDLYRLEWDNFVESVGSDVYMSPSWCRVWWRHYGRGELCVLEYRHLGEIVGLLPLFIETIWIFPVRLRIARLVGSDSTISVIKLALSAKHATAVLASAMRALFVTERCDIVLIAPLAGEAQRHTTISSAASMSGITIVRTKATGCYSCFELPDTYSDYEKSLAKRQRENLRRDQKQLGKAHKVEVEVVTDGQKLERAVIDFIEMHERQWRARNRLGHFGDWRGSESFTQDLVTTLAPLNGVRLIRLMLDGKVIAWEFLLRFGRVVHWRLPAREAGENWDKLGLGRLGLAYMLRASIDEGAAVVEGGPGHYEYKVKHGAKEYPIESYLLAASKAGRLKGNWFALSAFVIDLVYYRLWFLRLHPLLPSWCRGPLSGLWMRRRF